MNDMLHSWLGHNGPVLFVVVLLEQIGLPIPAAPCLLAAGALCATDQAAPASVIGLTILACLMADLAWFFVGRRGGKTVLNLVGRLALSRVGGIERVEQNFVQRGMALVAVSKFVPGLGLLVPPLAGALQIHLGRFLLFDLLSSIMYASAYLLFGIIFSQEVEAGLRILNQLGLGALFLLTAGLIGYFACKYICRKSRFHSVVSEKVQTRNLSRQISMC